MRTLTMVRSRVERASLWKVMIMEVSGSEAAPPSVQSFALQARLLESSVIKVQRAVYDRAR